MTEVKTTYEFKDLKPGLVSLLLDTEAVKVIPIHDADSIDLILTVISKKN